MHIGVDPGRPQRPDETVVLEVFGGVADAREEDDEASGALEASRPLQDAQRSGGAAGARRDR